MYSTISERISPFTVLQLVHRASEFEKQGHRVVHFEIGEPDFSTAEPIVKKAQSSINQGLTKYTSAQGISELRNLISNFYKDQGIEVSSDRIIVTSGASGGLILLSSLLLNPGDEMLITDPSYPCNEVFTRLVGGLPKKIVVSAENKFQPTIQDIKDAWTENTKGILLASPANPTGTLLDPHKINEIQNFVEEKNGFFILDEIYQTLSNTYTSGLSFNQNIFVLNSFSKYFGMTGWRLGWLVAPETAIDPLIKLAQNLFISPSSPAQYGALAAFEEDAMAIHKERQEVFQTRAKLLAEGLMDLGFVIPVLPEAAFYLYVDISHTKMDSNDFCWKLMEDYKVAVTPGYDFAEVNAEKYVRFAFTTGEDSIILGLERIKQALNDWNIL
jgi:aspartate/methionine/tyrosine aminotransferase